MEDILKILITVLIGSGLGTFFVERIFEHRLNKKLSRFNTLYTDKINVIKELYKLLIKAEKALDLFLSQREPENIEENIKFKDQTVLVLNKFRDYFEENEILFDNSIVAIVEQITNNFQEAKITQIQATIMEADRGSKAWEKAIDKKTQLWKLLVDDEIPKLKQNLKSEFQKKYQLLEK